MGTEKYLQSILDNSRVIIITTDTKGRIVEFNKEAEKLLEYAKEEVVGKDVLTLYHSPERRRELTGQPGKEIWAVRDRDVLLKSRSGRLFHVNMTLSTLVDDNGSIIGTVGIGKDTTEEKRLQQKLLQQEKLAGIGTLATGIAHEINNPLAGILGMAEAIRDENDIEVIKSHADDIIQYSLEASYIVKELSTYSRAAQSDIRSKVDISAVIENSLKKARHSVNTGPIKIRLDLSKGSFALANSIEMQQVFVNLIINAVHAMDSGGELAISCKKDESAIIACVSDTGCGIPEENLGRIFDPFFTTKPVGKGTGLGLYVVFRIIEKHRGAIEVYSEKGKGTAFNIRLPEYKASAKENTEPSGGMLIQ